MKENLESYLTTRYDEEETKNDIDALRNLVSNKLMYVSVLQISCVFTPLIQLKYTFEVICVCTKTQKKNHGYSMQNELSAYHPCMPPLQSANVNSCRELFQNEKRLR